MSQQLSQGGRRLVRGLMILLMVTGLPGCTVKLFYGQADWLIPWYVDRQLDIGGEQKEALKQMVSRQLYWHRDTQVLGYISTLDAWQQFFSAPFSKEELISLNQQTQTHLDVFAHHLLPDLCDFLYSLSPKQRLSIYALIKKSNQAFYEQYLAEGVDLDQVRFSDSREAVLSWFGSVSKSQEAAILRLSLTYQPTELETLKNRKRSLSHLKQVLASSSDKEDKTIALKSLLLSPREQWSQGYKRRFDYNAEVTKVLIEQMLKSASPRQQDHMMRRLAKWQKGFRAISEEGAD